jgi:HD-like signal output (HDOD) protein
VGAVVAEQWGLPEAAIRAILEHHGASEGGELSPLSRRIQAADTIAHALRSPDGISLERLVEVVGAPLLQPEQLFGRLCQLAEQCEP